MKKQDEHEKRTDRFRSLCSTSGLLLSVVCCIALIHVELRIQEHHRLISHSVTICDQLETQILRKVQKNYGRWQDEKGSHSQGHWRETRGKIRSCLWHFENILRATVCKYRESGVSREIFNFFIFCSNNLYSELFSKILLKGPEAL